MKHLSKFLFVFFVIITFGCSNDAPGNQELCFTPPATFSFEIVDKTTGENLFTNGTLDISKISVKDLDSPTKNVQFEFIKENNINLLRLGYIGWKTETINYSVEVDNKQIFQFHVEATRVSNKCSYTEFKNFEIKNATYQFDSTRGIYTILIEKK